MATKSAGDDEVTPDEAVVTAEGKPAEPEAGEDTATAETAEPEGTALTPEAQAAADEVRRPVKGRMGRMERRRQKIRDEIERNRRGDFKVPTWVLTVALIAFVAAWAALIFWA
ncbi:hypothetical protein Afil01_38960 [Actinorhabdospora filicis]|uniref:Uncharacterized protein n=1 Tax=Actinorhabdospora filicis TaxID=1785913 RepID=A0A9W6SNF6_9ACTN|nr:hypothetical protein [Actinorhabdospora filicis]GLZ79089.1 hypothetical protein Afil01_38960 [Actinorhabdospora filicis]